MEKLLACLLWNCKELAAVRNGIFVITKACWTTFIINISHTRKDEKIKEMMTLKTTSKKEKDEQEKKM